MARRREQAGRQSPARRARAGARRTNRQYGGRELNRLTIKQILQWADDHFERTGRWPKRRSDDVALPAGESWSRIDNALYVGCRGLRGGSSLPKLLRKRRGVIWKNATDRPRLTVKTILKWADQHRERHGTWPTKEWGQLDDAPQETWMGIDSALQHGRRGLPGGDSLTYFLHRHRGKPYNNKAPGLTIEEIRTWARQHFARTGNWPTQTSGPVFGVPGERWGNIQSALYKGSRGFHGGSSLPKVIADLKGGSV